MMTDNVLSIDNNRSMGIKDEKGRWIRGPGRAIGSKNKISSELAKQIRALGPKAVAALAIGIDKLEPWAITTVIKLVVPGRLTELHGSEPVDIRAAFEAGEITADELAKISTGLERLRSVESIDELRERLTELETILAAK